MITESVAHCAKAWEMADESSAVPFDAWYLDGTTHCWLRDALLECGTPWTSEEERRNRSDALKTDMMMRE